MSDGIHDLRKIRNIFSIAIKENVKGAKRQLLITEMFSKNISCPSRPAFNRARCSADLKSSHGIALNVTMVLYLVTLPSKTWAQQCAEQATDVSPTKGKEKKPKRKKFTSFSLTNAPLSTLSYRTSTIGLVLNHSVFRFVEVYQSTKRMAPTLNRLSAS